MQRHRQVDRQWASGQRANARHNANSRNRNVARRNAHVAVDAFDSTPHGRFVGEWFAHAHEHDVGHSLFALFGVARGAHHLFDNFAHGELTIKASLTSGTKTAGHCTARLGAHTHGGAIGIVHEHSFNRVIAVGELPQKFDCVAFVAHTFAHEQQTGGQFFAQPFAQRCRQGGDVFEWLALFIHAGPQLLHSVGGFTGQHFGQLRTRGVVQRAGSHHLAVGRLLLGVGIHFVKCGAAKPS